MGRSETDTVMRDHPNIVAKLAYVLNGALKAGPDNGFIFLGSDVKLSDIVFDLNLIALSDANKPFIPSAVAPVVKAVHSYGATNPDLTVIPAHDGNLIAGLIADGHLTQGFAD